MSNNGDYIISENQCHVYIKYHTIRYIPSKCGAHEQEAVTALTILLKSRRFSAISLIFFLALFCHYCIKPDFPQKDQEKERGNQSSSSICDKLPF